MSHNVAAIVTSFKGAIDWNFFSGVIHSLKTEVLVSYISSLVYVCDMKSHLSKF